MVLRLLLTLVALLTGCVASGDESQEETNVHLGYDHGLGSPNSVSIVKAGCDARANLDCAVCTATALGPDIPYLLTARHCIQPILSAINGAASLPVDIFFRGAVGKKISMTLSVVNIHVSPCQDQDDKYFLPNTYPDLISEVQHRASAVDLALIRLADTPYKLGIRGLASLSLARETLPVAGENASMLSVDGAFLNKKYIFQDRVSWERDRVRWALNQQQGAIMEKIPIFSSNNSALFSFQRIKNAFNVTWQNGIPTSFQRWDPPQTNEKYYLGDGDSGGMLYSPERRGRAQLYGVSYYYIGNSEYFFRTDANLLNALNKAVPELAERLPARTPFNGDMVDNSAPDEFMVYFFVRVDDQALMCDGQTAARWIQSKTGARICSADGRCS